MTTNNPQVVTPPGVLGILWASTMAFYERFGVEPTLENTPPRLREEVEELIAALENGEPKTDAAKEAADVLVTVLGACMAGGLTLTDIVNGGLAVAAKNDAKTHTTHYIREDGKIARREGEHE